MTRCATRPWSAFGLSPLWIAMLSVALLGPGSACGDSGGGISGGADADTIGGGTSDPLDGSPSATDATDADDAGGPVEDATDKVSCAQDDDCAAVWSDLDNCERAECLQGWCERTFTDDASLCDDGNHCTVDLCDVKGSCQYEVADGPGCCAEDADCDDGNPCTDAACGADAKCVFTANADPCDDGNPCTDGDTCQAGVCSGADSGTCHLACTLTGAAGEIASCAIDLARLEDSSPAVGLAFGIDYEGANVHLDTILAPWCKGVVCGTSSIPTDTSSLESTGHTVFLEPNDPAAWAGEVAVEILHISSPAAAINDAWIDGDSLAGGPPALFVLKFELQADVAGEPVLLTGLTPGAAGGAPLAATVVDGLIVTSDEGCGTTVCEDGNPCTTETCDAGSCAASISSGVACDDGNPCTGGDACSEDGLCAPAELVADGTLCAGDDLCNAAGTCDGQGTCVMEAITVTCDPPADPCLTSFCDGSTGECAVAPNPGVACDDGDACTAGDTCGGDGTCAGAGITCDDGVGCTIDGCDPASGCTVAPDHAACDDGSACTDGSCDVAAGCVQTPNTASCDDGDECTDGDTCAGGVCGGALDPSCGCETTPDCAPLEDGNPCTGTFVCLAGSCTIDPATVPSCPGDGFECMSDWTCNPASGQCEGQASLSCDDDDPCTADTCSTSKGCEHALVPGCAEGFICELSGASGAVITCPLRLARGAASDPVPSGGDVKLSWDADVVSLTNLTDEFCVGPTCFPFDLIVCGADGTGCSAQKLEPSGHDVVLVPDQKAAWTDWISVLLFHGSSPGKAISSAVVQSGATTGGDPQVLLLHFELLTDVPAGDPVQIHASDYHFNPATGLNLDVSIEVLGGWRTFVAREP